MAELMASAGETKTADWSSLKTGQHQPTEPTNNKMAENREGTFCLSPSRHRAGFFTWLKSNAAGLEVAARRSRAQVGIFKPPTKCCVRCNIVQA